MQYKANAHMNELKKELNFVQGTGVLFTSLLGTGVFAVPVLTVQIMGRDSLWAWPILVLLVLPVATTFATLGRYFPSAGGLTHFIGVAFGPRMAKVSAWLFLSIIPVGLPAALHIAAGFWEAQFGWKANSLLLVQLISLFVIWLLGSRSAGTSGNIQTLISLMAVALIVAIWWRGDITPGQVSWPSIGAISSPHLLQGLAMMFWCFVGMEAFIHLATEFRHSERDFPRALVVGTLAAGAIYWAFTVAVLHFDIDTKGHFSVVSFLKIISKVFGDNILWAACIMGYLTCFASVNIYIQGFARLLWSQAQEKPSSKLAQLSSQQVPLNALSVIVGCCALSVLFGSYLDMLLGTWMLFANGAFGLLYLLTMLAGCKILRGGARVVAIIGALLCGLLLIVIGWKSAYALLLFVVFWFVVPSKRESVHEACHH